MEFYLLIAAILAFDAIPFDGITASRFVLCRLYCGGSFAQSAIYERQQGIRARACILGLVIDNCIDIQSRKN